MRLQRPGEDTDGAEQQKGVRVTQMATNGLAFLCISVDSPTPFFILNEKYL